MDESTDPDFGPEAYKNHRGGCTCPDCAEDREFRRLRDAAARLVTTADEAGQVLASLEIHLGAVTSSHHYQEFYRLTMDDEDAAAHLAEARRALRSFGRIARERAARTEQNP